MSSKVIVLWGVIIIGLVISIYLLGASNKESLELSSKFNQTIKAAVNEYIESEKKEIPLKINSDDLVTKGYLNELIDGNKVCQASILVKKIIFIKSYDIHYSCEIKMTNDNED